MSEFCRPFPTPPLQPNNIMVSISIQSSIFCGADSPPSHVLSASIGTRSQQMLGPRWPTFRDSAAGDGPCLSGPFWLALWEFSRVCWPDSVLLTPHRIPCWDPLLPGSVCHICGLVHSHVLFYMQTPGEHESQGIHNLCHPKRASEIRKTSQLCLVYLFICSPWLQGTEARFLNVRSMSAYCPFFQAGLVSSMAVTLGD